MHTKRFNHLTPFPTSIHLLCCASLHQGRESHWTNSRREWYYYKEVTQINFFFFLYFFFLYSLWKSSMSQMKDSQTQKVHFKDTVRAWNVRLLCAELGRRRPLLPCWWWQIKQDHLDDSHFFSLYFVAKKS